MKGSRWPSVTEQTNPNQSLIIQVKILWCCSSALLSSCWNGWKALMTSCLVKNRFWMHCTMGTLQRVSFFTLEITLELHSRYGGRDGWHHRLSKTLTHTQNTHFCVPWMIIWKLSPNEYWLFIHLWSSLWRKQCDTRNLEGVLAHRVYYICMSTKYTVHLLCDHKLLHGHCVCAQLSDVINVYKCRLYRMWVLQCRSRTKISF